MFFIISNLTQTIKSSIKFQIFFFLIILFFPLKSFSNEVENYLKSELPKPSGFVIETHDAVIKGLRYANPGGQPVVLFHGFDGNSRSWKDVGYFLYRNGFDVWMPNFRGHGKGDHRSYVKYSKKDSYTLRKIFTVDAPAIIDFVHSKTGQKMHIMGHSMGGMTVKAYAAGVSNDIFGHLVADEDLALDREATRIISIVAIGAPHNFKKMPLFISAMAKLFYPIFKDLNVNIDLPTLGDERAPTLPDKKGVREFFKRLSIKHAHPIIRGLFPKWAGLIENIDPDEVVPLAEKGSSKIPLQLLIDFGSLVYNKNYVLDGLDLSKLQDKIWVRSLLIGGSHDGLAPAKDVKEDGYRFLVAREANPLLKDVEHKSVILQKTSHIDLIIGKMAVKKIGSLILGFISPKRSIKDSTPPPLDVFLSGKCRGVFMMGM